MIVQTYSIYLVISLAITVWVARTLSHNGRVFLVDGFGGKEALADSINHLLVVGFYLINIGYVLLNMQFFREPADLGEMFLFLGTRIGFLLLALGLMHFFNMFVISRLRQRALNYRREADKKPAADQPDGSGANLWTGQRAPYGGVS